MEKLLNRYIKEIIDEFPKVGTLLEEFKIGCVTCNVGTCLLKDIIEIHNLPGDEERVILAGIAKIVYPDREIEIPEIKRKAKSEGVSYSPPMKILVDEHVFIKRLIAQIPNLIKELESNPENGKILAEKSIDFIKNYADKFHHAKEEDILFKYFDENLDILKVMYEEHKIGRGHVKSIVEGLASGDGKCVAEHLDAYGKLLTQHIKKEDEILYPWQDRNLTTNQVGEMFSKFQQVRQQFCDKPAEYEEFVISVEQIFKP